MRMVETTSLDVTMDLKNKNKKNSRGIVKNIRKIVNVIDVQYRN